MPAIASEMNGYSVATGQFRFNRGVDRVRKIFFPSFAQSRDMIDIYRQFRKYHPVLYPEHMACQPC